MYEAIFRVDEPSSPIPTAGRDVRVDLWCTDHCDLVRAVGGDADEALADVAAAVGIADRIVAGEEHVAITETCLASERPDNLERYVGRHGCLLLSPLRYADGNRICRLLALQSDALRDVYRDLVADGYTVEVESKRTVETVASDRPLLDPGGLVPELTARQRETIELAIAGGYYEIPREISTADIADHVGVERRTAEDHLRRAERKLIDAIATYL
ncbi:helix-turn-helix domain-containing protein [Natrarchaeobaculum sulfurireducens]|uniref:Bacterio-opsin activator domain-containing protein n=1 Tax=Natrarchaeobaculum sulfurireducens TaxID=2044521 RepID=A0A346PNP7_9EURY|nr:helix-turn-helix domain-containing protein [Natrarchaeobaculum sulfurireducens]AXR78811.1 Transcriptional regulator, contains HTH domain [Natrarchaeobaculum sulfurireducens]AXR81142.1 Bacterio-opsin activator domain-containing protein [Natrarchaeobaculum sulfurireducens]